jgi:hypothetical protein
MSTDQMIDLMCEDNWMQQAADTLAAERHDSILHALYHCEMCGVPDEMIDVLCDQLKIDRRELNDFVPPILRPTPVSPEECERMARERAAAIGEPWL